MFNMIDVCKYRAKKLIMQLFYDKKVILYLGFINL